MSGRLYSSMLCWRVLPVGCFCPGCSTRLQHGVVCMLAAAAAWDPVAPLSLDSLQLLMVPMCLQVNGDITYNGEGFDSFQVARTSAYISQVDEHQAELTVRETFDFAARCLGVGHKQGRPPHAVAGALPEAMCLQGYSPTSSNNPSTFGFEIVVQHERAACTRRSMFIFVC